MSIPLDRLYHYIENIAKEVDEDIVIYRFYPHGSKKLENLNQLGLKSLSWAELQLIVAVVCHDQEPLNYGVHELTTSDNFFELLKSLGVSVPTTHNLTKNTNIYNKTCLLHSEKRSDHVIKYQNNQCIPIYYWSHALISLDWFRFAQHCQQQKQVKKTFLIYNRAWAGTREYRLKFSEFLISLNLQDCCKISLNPVDPELGIHYETHRFENPIWRPCTVLENYFLLNTAHSHSSADFALEDYEVTDIEVVLETLFEDTRLHLTEKSLRPIACGQPFILAGTHGSMEYLRSYGFKTFMHIWDERYDLIEDPYERLAAIADLMKQISTWMPHQRENKMAQARAIADYNKKHFFSKEFFDLIVNELTDNLSTGIKQVKLNCDFQPFVDTWQHLLTFKEVREYLENPKRDQSSWFPTTEQVKFVLNTIKK
jgi:hypothetical protein